MKALRDFNEAKFTRTDCIILEGIIKDVFNLKPGTNKNEKINIAVREE